ncbi:hypothetical protein F4778DRAFT_407866 [Xylariomycetidae sp. FL2044]|nr:hypothetical protein F4778DRAFT_407866 [Xylariomycetidae sp. FL2044]
MPNIPLYIGVSLELPLNTLDVTMDPDRGPETYCDKYCATVMAEISQQLTQRLGQIHMYTRVPIPLPFLDGGPNLDLETDPSMTSWCSQIMNGKAVSVKINTPLCPSFTIVDSIDPMWDSVSERISLQPEHLSLCSTHLRLSLPSWEQQSSIPIEDVKKIAFAAIYFESAIDACLPTHWKMSEWVFSNQPYVESVPVKDIRMIWKAIDRQSTAEDLASLVCPRSKSFHRWSFFPPNLPRMIEFRRLPPSTTRRSVENRVGFLWGFVTAALEID